MLGSDYDNWDYAGEHTGLGFLPAATATGAAVGGPIGAIVGTIAGAIASIFGFGIGPPSSTTSYRPPADTTGDYALISEPTGDVYVAYDLNPNTLAIAAANGNKADDIYSYYSAFVSNSVHAGASDAARRVLEDASRKYGISIAQAADWLLSAAGIPRIVQSFLPSGQGSQTGAPTGLPPYCPVGTYHPYPIGHPEQDLCVPFPGWETGGQEPTARPPGATTPTGTIARTAQAVAGYYLSRRTGTYQRVPACPSGTVFDEASEQCVSAGAMGGGQSLESLFANTPLWLWGLLILLLALMLSDGGDGATTTTITRRKR